MKKNYKKYLIISLILFIIFSLTIGFAAFENKLYIDQIALTVRSVKDIRVTGINCDTSTNGGSASLVDYNYAKTFTDITLPSADSTVTCAVEITNIGTVDMGIFDITDLTNSLPDNIEFSVSGYKLRDKICDGSKCNSGVIKDIYLTFKYKDEADAFDESNTSYNITLDYDFRGFYNITYVDIDSKNYPSYIMEGDTLDFTFKNKIPLILRVYKEHLLLDATSDYTYQDGHIILKDVDGDLELRDLTNIMYEFVAYSNTGTDENVDFSDQNVENGLLQLNSTTEYDYPVYYYRGDHTLSNNVLFGGYCWLIVRTTDTGGVKLIFNGDIQEKVDAMGETIETCPGINTTVDTTSYPMANGTDKNADSIASVGYMYGTMYGTHRDKTIVKSKFKTGQKLEWLDGDDYTGYNIKTTSNLSGTWSSADLTTLDTHHYTCLSTSNKCGDGVSAKFIFYYDSSEKAVHYLELKNGKLLDDAMNDMVKNTHDSSAKSIVDLWYENNIQKYESYIEDTIYCNDRTIDDLAGFDPVVSITNRYLLFAGYNRFENKTPSLTCSKNDSFTVSESIGNGALKHPVGMLTADEVMYAGALNSGTANHKFFLNGEEKYWLMTAYNFDANRGANIFGVKENGDVAYLYADEEDNGIRPVISLKYGTKYTSGDGSTDYPFYVDVGDVSDHMNLYKMCSGYDNMEDCMTNNDRTSEIPNTSDGPVADMYRFQGSSIKVNNNYICFGTSNKDTCLANQDKYLYRIIGIEPSGRLKLIKKEALEDTYQWNEDIVADIQWDQISVYNSLIKDAYLTNEEYVPLDWEGKISDQSWKMGDMFGDETTGGARQTGLEVYKVEMGQKPAFWYEDATADDPEAKSAVATGSGDINGTTVYYTEHTGPWTASVTSKVGLMYISDYYLSVSNEANCQQDLGEYEECSNGWVSLSHNDTAAPNPDFEWLLDRTGWSYNWGRFNGFAVSSTGFVNGYSLKNMNSVRPVIYLTPSIQINGGTGLHNNPYMISSE